MSNDTDRDGHTYMNYELQQELNEVRQEDPLASLYIETLRRTAYPGNIDPNNSGDEDRSWGNTQFRRNNAATQEQAASRSDSDPEPERQVRRRRAPRNRDELRRARLAAQDTHVSEAQRDVLEREFGDPWRRVPAWSGRGWENTRGIAEGERSSLRTYGPSSDALANTSLAGPLRFSSQREPSRAERENVQVVQERVVELLLADRQQAEEAASDTEDAIRLERQRAAIPAADSAHNAVTAYRRSGEEERLLEELDRRVQQWAQDDQEAHRMWEEYREEVRRATDSPSREYQMVLWYTGGPLGSVHDANRRVPPRVLRQLRRVELYYTELARLQRLLEHEEYHDGSLERVPTSDNSSQGVTRRQFFGYERYSTLQTFTHSDRQGRRFYSTLPTFAHYDSQGRQDEALLSHLSASFETRRIRLLHATSQQEFEVLRRRMRSFVDSALLAFPDLISVGNHPAADFQDRVDSQRDLLITFLDNRMRYSGPIGRLSRGGDDTNASDIEPIENGIPAAWEAVWLEKEERANQHPTEIPEHSFDSRLHYRRTAGPALPPPPTPPAAADSTQDQAQLGSVVYSDPESDADDEAELP